MRKFCDEFGIPITETQAGKGVLGWNYRWNAGPIGSNGATSANELAKETDLIIAVGTRLTDFTTASRTQFQNPDVRFLAINVTPMDASKLSALPLVADAKRALVDLTAALKEAGYRGTSEDHRAKVSKLKEEWDKRVTEIRTPKDKNDVTEIEAIGLINEAVGGKATVVCAAGNMPGELLRLWRPDEPKAYHLEYGFSCMGYEIPGGIGVKLAEPERDVVVMIGDGTYLMMNSEIVTAVSEDLTLTIVIIDNHGYQCILGLQRICGVSDFGNELRFRDPKTGMLNGDFVPIDFVKHAEAMGAHAVLVKTADEITSALKEAKHRRGVSVVVIPVDPEKRMPSLGTWWDVPVAEVSTIEKTRQTRANYEKVSQEAAHCLRMKLATAPVNWNSPDVPEYRDYTPYPQLLEEMLAAGYTATEWSSIMPKDPEVLRRDLQAHGMKLIGGFVGLELRDPAKRAQAIAKGLEIGNYFKSLGATYLIAADSGDARRIEVGGHVGSGDSLTDEQWRSLGSGLNELATALKPAGIQLVFHNHVGTYVETEAETCRLLDETEPSLVGWCLDCGHLAYGGGDTLKMLEKYGNRVGHVHLKDVNGEILVRALEERLELPQSTQGLYLR